MKYKNLILELFWAVVVAAVSILLYNSFKPNKSIAIGSKYLYANANDIDTVTVIEISSRTVTVSAKNDTIEVLKKVFLSNSEPIAN